MLFLFNGGRSPLGLALYHILSAVTWISVTPKQFRFIPTFYPLVALILFGFISTLSNGNLSSNWIHWATLMSHAANFLSFAIIFEENRTKKILFFIFSLSCLAAVTVLLSEVFSPIDNRFSVWRTIFFPNSNLEAGFLSLGILLPLPMFQPIETKSTKAACAIGISMGCVILGFLLLYSRGASLGLIAGSITLYYLLGRKSFKMMAYTIIVILAVFIAVPRILNPFASKVGTDAMTLRISIWKSALTAYNAKPILGWGLGGFEAAYKLHRIPDENSVGRFEKSTAFAHNEFLQIAVETGILGLSAWMMFVWILLKNGFKQAKENPENWEITAALACVVSLLVHSFFDFNLHLPILGFLFSFFAAVLLKSPNQIDGDKSGTWSKNAVRTIRFAGGAWATLSVYFFLTLVLSGHRLSAAAYLNPFSRDILEKLLSQPVTPDHLISVEKAAPFHKKEDRVYAYLARGYSRRGKTDEAVASYAKAITINPKSPFYHCELADLYLFKKDAPNASQNYLMALKLEPFYIYPRFRFAQILASQGMKQEAFQECLKIQKIADQRLPADSEYVKRLLENNPKAVIQLMDRLKI